MKKNNLSLSQEIKIIDKKIATMINQRSRLLSKFSQIRRNRSESFADAALEKDLWSVWKEELKKSNQSLVRQLYTIINSLGYSMAEKTSSDKPFCLYPPTAPINLNIPGPRATKLSHFVAFLFALSQEKQEIRDFLINDSIIELIKLANQCGAQLTWQDNILTGQGRPVQSMDGQNLFINHSLFNFYLFLCLGLGTAGRIKFNASALLKAVNLRNLESFIPQLGARLYSIEPQSYSLPARLESSGLLPTEIYLPEDIDPLFVKALIMSASTYEKGLLIKYDYLDRQSFKELFSLLKEAGISLEIRGMEVAVSPSNPGHVSSEIPLDPFLSGFLLSMAPLSHGRVSLKGTWPAHSAIAEDILHLLKRFGIYITLEENAVIAQGGTKSNGGMFDLTDRPELAPLIFPLALSLCDAEKVEFVLSPELENYDIIAQLLAHTGYNFTPHLNGIRVISRQASTEKNSPWNSPDPHWTLGYCLLSFTHKGICLANPGNITTLWPGFWKIFMNLANKKSETSAETKGDIDGKPARKRIRV